MDKKNNVAYMKDYLKFAVEFEKNVYIWSHAMSKANERMRQLYDQRKKLENRIKQTKENLRTTDSVNERRIRQKESEAEQCRRTVKSTKKTLAVILIVLCLLGCLLGYGLYKDPEFSAESKIGIYVIPAFAVAIPAIFSLFPMIGVLPICMGIITSNKNKAANLEAEAQQMARGDSVKRQLVLLKAEESELENDEIVTAIEESVVSERQEEIQTALTAAKKNLAQIYSENVLPQKYRTLTAVATLYEYLETGRCDTIQGHGGIYDTYEVERLHLEQLYQMAQMNAALNRIEDAQRYIYQEMKQANRTLSSINKHLNEIERSNAEIVKNTGEIARNTAISAAANQQTAAAAQYLAWASGY